MAVLGILTHPDPKLGQKAQKVKSVSYEVKKLVDDLFETMSAGDAVGLAANQVGVMKRVIVLDSRQNPDERLALINPTISSLDGEEEVDEEGCMSLPAVFGPVKRAKRVEVRALDPDGNRISMTAEGYLGRIIQHEVDHLDGVLFFERMDVVSAEKLLREYEEKSSGLVPSMSRSTRDKQPPGM
jgi:peptide deformylase